MTTVGERIKEWRQRVGLSQTQLAGDDLSPSYISLIESGRRQPSQEVISALAQRLGCNPDELTQEVPESERQRVDLELAYAQLALQHGAASDARDRLEQLLAESGLRQAQRDQASYALARGYEQTGDLAGAIRVLLPMLDRACAGECAVPAADVSNLLCWCYAGAGDLNAAIRAGEAGLRAIEASGLAGTTEYLRLAANVMGAYYDLGDTTHATVYTEYLQSLVDESGPSPSGQSAIWWNAAYLADAQGRIDEAVRLCERALALSNELGTNADLPRLRVETALFVMRADPSRAREASALLDRALPELQDLGSSTDMANWESARALADLLLGQPMRAEQLARKALLNLTAHPGPDLARALLTLGDSLIAQGRAEEALVHVAAAKTAIEGSPRSRQVAALYREVAERQMRLGQHEAALASYSGALDMAGIQASMAVADAALTLSQRPQPTETQESQAASPADRSVAARPR